MARFAALAVLLAALLAAPAASAQQRSPSLPGGCLTDACKSVQTSCTGAANMLECLCTPSYQTDLASCSASCTHLPKMEWLAGACSTRTLNRRKRSVDEEPAVWDEDLQGDDEGLDSDEGAEEGGVEETEVDEEA
ncbi:hypothetical protein DFJ74DRAFT_701193 [Hyaloraphidium curvatum]|nr:hypothetical protein DFJ74DRAFT_701193 [Hyaloraphidium curvatum]